MTLLPSPSVNHVALIGNFPPRKCGIATFTADLRAALHSVSPEMRLSSIVMNDPGQKYAYSGYVDYEIEQNNRDDYRAAVDHINSLDPDAISIQHEFGIYGGAAGEYLLQITEYLRAPITTTLHTVLTTPNADQRRVLDKLAEHSSRLVVMTEMGRDILNNTWHIPDSKIAVIPHGIPDLPFLDPALQKQSFGLSGRKVILTFGLLSPNKGIENMIEALPEIVLANPNVTYIVLGATHPHLIAHEGEAYRQQVKEKAKELGVAEHVHFVNKFVDAATLQAWLTAADVYVTPYTYEQQITSGTLSYAVGMGKAVVSTPYWHARELLANGTGELVPFNDSNALSKTVNMLLADDTHCDRLRNAAYKAGRQMIWPVVGKTYIDLFTQTWAEPTAGKVQHLRTAGKAVTKPNLKAVSKITDSCGILQHSRSSVPDRRHGYCLDDNARALMLAVDAKSADIQIKQAKKIIDTCASFVDFAWDEDSNVFRNFMDYQRNWLEHVGSEDSHGRAVWSLGRVIAGTDDHNLKLWATGLIERVIPASTKLSSPRAIAFTILGLISYTNVFPGHRQSRQLIEGFAQRLQDILNDTKNEKWYWFEPVLAYDNARLSEALIRAGKYLHNNAMLADGLATLEWLAAIQTNGQNNFRPVGTESFGKPFVHPRPYDQQPLEAWAMIDACNAAITVSADSQWRGYAQKAFNWYFGYNDLGLRIAMADGSCYDGLHMDRVNLNQGAESVLSLQFAIMSMRQLVIKTERDSRSATL